MNTFSNLNVTYLFNTTVFVLKANITLSIRSGTSVLRDEIFLLKI